MAEIFFTSDHHFGHRGILSMCGRPFADVAEMDEVMIARWNERVRKGDTVYHLGDLTMGASAERGREIFDRLNGRKHLIIGNHDRLKVRDLPWASEPRDRLMLRHPGEKMPIVLDHYSLRTWPGLHHGAVHLYGHSHGSLPGVGRSIDVGVDVWDFAPVTLAEIRPTLERQHEEFERQREAARMFHERAARGDPAKALAILKRLPSLPEDPLGYDTSDPGYLREMAEDALAGRHEDAVDAELANVRRALAGRLSGLGTIEEQAELFARLWRDNQAATRVVSDPDILDGEPHVLGTTVPAQAVLEEIRGGLLDFEIRVTFPTLPEDAVDVVREWAAGMGLPKEPRGGSRP